MAQSLRFCSAAFPQPKNEHEVVNMLTMSIKNVHDEVVKVHEEKKALRAELSLANERLQVLEDFFFFFNSKDSRHKNFLSSSSSFTATGSPTSLASLASGSSHNSAAGDKQEYPFNGLINSAAETGKVSPVLNLGSATPDMQAKSPLRSVRTPYVSLVDAILGPAPPSRGPRPEPGSPLGAATMVISAATIPATTGNTENSETARRTFWIANREIYVSQMRGQAFNTVEEVRFLQEKASRDGLEQSAALKKSLRDAARVMEGDKGKKKKIDGRRWKGKSRGGS